MEGLPTLLCTRYWHGSVYSIHDIRYDVQIRPKGIGAYVRPEAVASHECLLDIYCHVQLHALQHCHVVLLSTIKRRLKL